MQLERIGAKKTFLCTFADFDQKSGQKIRVCIKDWLITFYWGENFPKGFLKKLTGRSPALKWVVNELSIQFLSEDNCEEKKFMVANRLTCIYDHGKIGMYPFDLILLALRGVSEENF